MFFIKGHQVEVNTFSTKIYNIFFIFLTDLPQKCKEKYKIKSLPPDGRDYFIFHLDTELLQNDVAQFFAVC